MITTLEEPMTETAVLADYDEVPDRLLHKKGCPKNRVETFLATRPAMNSDNADPRKVNVERCLDCGNQHTKEA